MMDKQKESFGGKRSRWNHKNFAQFFLIFMAELASVPASLWQVDDLEERKWNYLLETDESLGGEAEGELTRDINASPPEEPLLNVPNLDFELPTINWDEEPEELTRSLETNEIYSEKRRTIAVKASNRLRSACVVSEDDYELAKAKVTEKVNEIVAQKRQYTDPIFSAQTPKKILFRNSSAASTQSFKAIESKIASWQRLTNIIEGPVVFRDGIDCKDIQQGSIGTCWFLSALSVVSCREERIKRCLVKYNIALGVYGFVFFKNGRWVHVIIDDFFPVSHYRSLLFSRSTDRKETWVALFEKAYAKLHGSYEMIVGGHVSNGVVDLTAGCSAVLRMDNLNEDAKTWLWKQLANKASKNWRCTGCSNYRGGSEERAKTGLVSGHAYAVIGTYNHKGIKLIQVRNPWGQVEWKGAWSDKSPLWKKNPTVAKAVKLVDRDDGAFWMSWDDFLLHWDRVYLVKCFSKNWKSTQRFGKTCRKGTYATSFHLNTPGPLSIMVQPECHAFKGDLARKNSYAPMQFSVLEKGKEIANVSVSSFRGGSWWSAASGYTCPAGDYTVRVHYRTPRPSPFYVRVYSRTDVTMTDFS